MSWCNGAWVVRGSGAPVGAHDMVMRRQLSRPIAAEPIFCPASAAGLGEELIHSTTLRVWMPRLPSTLRQPCRTRTRNRRCPKDHARVRPWSRRRLHAGRAPAGCRPRSARRPPPWVFPPGAKSGPSSRRYTRMLRTKRQRPGVATTPKTRSLGSFPHSERNTRTTTGRPRAASRRKYPGPRQRSFADPSELGSSLRLDGGRAG